MEEAKLQLVRASFFRVTVSVGPAHEGVDMIANLRLVTKFNEQDPDTGVRCKKMGRFG